MDWQTKSIRGTAPSLRNSHRVAYAGSKLYVHGGRGSSIVHNDLFSLDLKTMTWTEHETSGAEAPARENHSVAIINGDLFVFGGSEYGRLSNELYSINLSTFEWKKVDTSGKAPSARERHSMVSMGNKLCVFGGHSNESEFLNDVYVLDTDTHTWTAYNPPKSPIPRNHHIAVSIKDKMYIFGGKSQNGYFNDVHCFDLSTKQWQQPNIGGIFPAGRWGHTGVAFGNRLIIFGGWNGTWCFSDLHLLDLDFKKWTRLQTAGTSPTARAYHGAAVVDKEMVVFGGRNGLRRMDDLSFLNLSKAFDKNGNPVKPESLRQVWKMDDFELGATLGTGSFGRVRFCRHKPTGKVLAIKMLKKSEILRLKQVDHILSEKNILSEIDHPFIVNLFGSFQDKKYLYLVMEYVIGGEFFTHLRRAGRFNNDTACFYAAQIVLIFQYLHSKDIVYRDLKPENLLLDARGNIKITDFGFGKKVEYRTWTLCGTPEYIAPEILLNKGHGKPVDWWALGILIFEMLAGAPPFVDDDPMGIYQKILAGKIEYPSYFNRHVKDLISRLLTADITKRLGNLKNGVEDIKRHPWFANINWTKLYNKKMLTPFVPKVKGEDDTTNFEYFPDSAEEAPDVNLDDDPFTDF